MRPLKLNIGSPEFKAEPIHEVRRLQSHGDAVHVNFPFMGKMVATTRAELTEHVLTRSDLFVSEPKNAGKPGKTLVPGWMPRSIKDLADNMVVKDDPDHKRLRSLVDRAFAKRSVIELQPLFDNLADSMLDQLDQNIELQGRADFIELVAKPLPVSAMIAMLGLPCEEHGMFTGWANSFANLSGLIEFWKVTRAIAKMRKYVSDLVEHRRFGDNDGLIASLVQAEEQGEKLSRDELTTTLTVLMTAGFETTTHLLNGAVWILARSPGVRQQLADKPELIDAFLNETLRIISPFVMTKPRLSAVDQDLGGVALKQGEYVLPMIVCSNYDDRLFEAPDRFDLHRPNANRNLSFGRGIHNCLGRIIAKAEVAAVVSAMLARPYEYRLVEHKWAKRIGSRNMEKLVLAKG